MSSGIRRSIRLNTSQALDAIIHDSDSDKSENETSDYDVMGDSQSDSDENLPVITPANTTPVTITSASSDWLHTQTFDHFTPEWCVKYSEVTGPKLPRDFDTENARPVDFFGLYFTEEVFTLMSDMTNNYALEYFDQPCEPPRHSRFNSWCETSPNEMKAFVGLQIAMGLCSKPRLSDYWAASGVTRTPGFSEVMPRNRYDLLCSFLHFSDNSNRVAKGEPGYDPLHKIRPLINLIKPRCSEYYVPKRELSVDETMRKFKGRIYFRQYLPNKPIRWGIKVWSLCESSTGYLLNWEVYTGKDTSVAGSRDDVSMTERVVMNLMENYIDCGHYLFVDNLYSSCKLFNMLKDVKTGACGTIRPNRVGFPVELRPANLKLKRGQEPVFYRNGDMLATAWHDTKRVHFLSTIDNNGCTSKQIRAKNSETGFRTVKKPNVACTYNKHMGGVDLFDQKCATYPYRHKLQKWYHAIFHLLKDAALVNAYVLYKSVYPESKMSSERFHQEISDQLKESIPRAKGIRMGGRKRKSTDKTDTDLPERLTGRHFPMTFADPKYKPDCEVCSRTNKHPARKQTRNGCADCWDGVKNVPMCLPDCFKRYHTVMNYKN